MTRLALAASLAFALACGGSVVDAGPATSPVDAAPPPPPVDTAPPLVALAPPTLPAGCTNPITYYTGCSSTPSGVLCWQPGPGAVMPATIVFGSVTRTRGECYDIETPIGYPVPPCPSIVFSRCLYL